MLQTQIVSEREQQAWYRILVSVNFRCEDRSTEDQLSCTAAGGMGKTHTGWSA